MLSVSIAALSVEPVADLTPPGQLVDIGTHKMHLHCKGEADRPVIILESGLGGFSLEWDTVQTDLSRTNHVCTYDRSGYGWSESSPRQRSSREIARELYLLLKTAGIPAPYILVGYSFGGYNIRYFASEYPALVSGLVFIDSSHPEQFIRMPKPVVGEIKEEVSRNRGWQIRLAMPRLAENFPEHYRRTAYILMSTSKARNTQLQELELFKTSAQQVIENDHLPDVPISVISRGMRVWPRNDFGDHSELVWNKLQNELASLGKHSIHVIAGRSGHSIHLDQPALVNHVLSELVAVSSQAAPPATLVVRKW